MTGNQGKVQGALSELQNVTTEMEILDLQSLHNLDKIDVEMFIDNFDLV